MSVLETPRIIFNGEISWDPIVTNNYSQFYDEDSAWTMFKDQESVDQFRQNVAAKEAVYNASHETIPSDEKSVGMGNWNPQGTHRSVMCDTFVTGVDLGGGVVTDDSLIKGAVDFKGMLVDAEPYGSFSSQLFFDSLSLGIEGGTRIYAPRGTRMTARYINFFRLPRAVYGFAASVASVNWQTAFAKEDGLKIDAHDSAALQALNKALESDDVLGITVRFNTYSTHYYGADESSEINERETELVAKLAGGGFQPNPARSQLTGVIGLWRKGEPIHEPGDRALLAAIAIPADGPPAAYMASVSARVAEDSISLDLSNSISETDLALTKQDLGTLILSVVDDSGTKIPLAEITNDQYQESHYRASSGILTLPLAADQVAAANQGTLQIEANEMVDGKPTGKPIPYLKEQALRAIPSEPNLYLNFGDEQTSDVIVLNRGRPAEAGINVSVVSVDGPIDSEATTDANGIASMPVSGREGQSVGFILAPDNASPPSQIDPQTTTYMYIRTLQDNVNFSDIKPTWDNVYHYCLRNWNAMAPCMDNWLDLKNEAQVKAYAHVIKRLTDEDNFEDFLFMPVTRDMTRGERKLLWDFLGLSTSSKQPETESIDSTQSHGALSQKMRQA